MVIAILAVAVIASSAPTQEVVRYIGNAQKMTELAVKIEQYRQKHQAFPRGQSLTEVITALGGGEGLQEYFAKDSWGTPYRARVDDAGYTITSAGVDGRFDTADDAVFSNGRFTKAPHDRAISEAITGTDEAALRATLERSKALRTTASVRNLTISLLTYLTDRGNLPTTRDRAEIQRLLGLSDAELADAWDTPFKLRVDGQHWTIVSAGADRKFDPDIKGKGVTRDYAADLINVDGEFRTEWDFSPGGPTEVVESLLGLRRATKELADLIGRN